MVRFFLAGIVQGSNPGRETHRQDYRERLKHVLSRTFPGAEVFCPVETNPNSMDYAFVKGAEVFFDLISRAAKYEVLLAYAPEASMGTAIEMWEAYRAGRLVITISPLKENWVVKFLSRKVCSSFEDFEAFATTGEFAKMVDAHLARAAAEGKKA